MSKIQVLDKLTSQSIAAGEVVERPSSVVKELIENSLDAGANRVSVSIRNGGKILIKIVDNGSGMSREDAELAFQDHATSKIRKIDDLNTVSTLGFRGEALPTIAAVSKIKLETRREEDSEGTQIIIEAGEIQSIRSVPSNVGTSIEVRDLFFNTPARFKFLKTDRGETTDITDTVQELALAREDVSFSLESNGKETIHTPGDNKLLSAIYAVFGAKMAKGMTEVLHNQSPNGVSIKGYLGLPEVSRNSRKWQYFFVNGRSIKSAVLQKAAEDAYKSTLMTQKFPSFVIKVELPSNLVDVNVHPRKLEVRFWNNNDIYRAVYHSVQNSLFTALRPASVDLSEEEPVAETETASDERKIYTPEESDLPKHHTRELEDGSVLVEPSRHSREEAAPPKIHFDFAGLGRLSKNDKGEVVSEEVKSYEAAAVEESSVVETSDETAEKREQLALVDNEALNERQLKELDFKNARYAGELFKTYLLFEINDKIIIIDQHAAHEKVLFEQALHEYEANKFINSQMLLEPVSMEISPQEEILIDEHPEFAKRYGFELDSFGPGTILIRSIPAGKELIDPEVALQHLFDDALENGVDNLTNERDRIYYILATSACKAAVKAHDVLSVIEVEELRRQLLSLDNPYHCPHGRPIILEINQKDMEKLFKRIV